MDKITQWAKIREYLKTHETASVRELFDACRINSPRKRISEMIAAGIQIGSYWDESVDEDGFTTRYKRYFLMGGDNNG